MNFSIKKRCVPTKNIPTRILNLKWLDTVTEKLQHLKCSACGQEIGKYRWASAWALVEGEKHERGLRLCIDCAKEAEKDISA